MTPVRVLSLGAGVQSTTVFLMSLHGEIPMFDHVIFADTGWEPDEVYQHLAWLQELAKERNIPFHKVTKGNIRQDFLDGEKHFAAIPFYITNKDGTKGMARRQCTSEYKLAPLLKKQRELAGLKPRQRSTEHLVTCTIGISYDEIQRIKDPLFSWIRHDYPLLDRKMTRSDCLDWCKSHGYNRPPRSACLGCPFKSQTEWRVLKQRPKEWQDVVEFDEALRNNPTVSNRYRGQAFLHPSRQPLKDVDLRTDEELGIQTLFDMECEGMCGL